MIQSRNPNTRFYSIVTSREYDEGLVPVPVAANKAKIAHIRVGAPMQIWVVAWEIRRDGAPPIAPHPRSLDVNNVFLRGSQSAVVPITNHDGRQEWAMSGSYLYSCVSPTGLEVAMPTGRLPWERTSASSNNIPANFFQKDLVGWQINSSGMVTPTPPEILQGITS